MPQQPNSRSVVQTVTGSRQVDGAGVRLVRVIGNRNVIDFDPFLMLDAFDSTDPKDYIKGFPWHPHRGIETVTYLIRGEVEHGDSLGNSGVIEDGCCQWMTAGGGIIHQEMPQACERMLGLQLWINLPARDKMTHPQYRDLTADSIPKLEEEGCRIAVISGQYQSVAGATAGDYVKAQVLDIQLDPGAFWSLETDPEETLFLYTFSGSGQTGRSLADPIASRRATLFDAGKFFQVKAGDEGLRFLLFAGRPLREPVAWGGPIVMNTQAELEQAFADLRQGTFIAT